MDQPYVIARIDRDAGDLTQGPVVGQGLGPGGVDRVARSGVFAHRSLHAASHDKRHGDRGIRHGRLCDALIHAFPFAHDQIASMLTQVWAGSAYPYINVATTDGRHGESSRALTP